MLKIITEREKKHTGIEFICCLAAKKKKIIKEKLKAL